MALLPFQITGSFGSFLLGLYFLLPSSHGPGFTLNAQTIKITTESLANTVTARLKMAKRILRWRCRCF
ncbi:hypothetical protein X975_17598, partial [Stegodyphus mimosarum]